MSGWDGEWSFRPGWTITVMWASQSSQSSALCEIPQVLGGLEQVL